MESLFQSAHDPKTMTVEKTDDGRLRVIISLAKLGQATALEYDLDKDDAQELKQALEE